MLETYSLVNLYNFNFEVNSFVTSLENSIADNDLFLRGCIFMRILKSIILSKFQKYDSTQIFGRKSVASVQ